MTQLVALALEQLGRLTLQSLRKSAQRTPAFILQQTRQPEKWPSDGGHVALAGLEAASPDMASGLVERCALYVAKQCQKTTNEICQPGGR